jgi:hypothetical protein
MSTNERDWLAGTSTNKHTTKWAGPDATTAVAAPAPPPSEPPPVATRYKGSAGDTNVRGGINMCRGCMHEHKVSAGCTNEHRGGTIEHRGR